MLLQAMHDHQGAWSKECRVDATLQAKVPLTKGGNS